MKKKLMKGMLITTGVLFVSGGILLGANVLEKTNDVIPPYGRLQIRGATEVNNINYVDRTSIEVEIHAKDNVCEDEEIQYYISTSPIDNTEALDESLWKDYKEGTVEKIDLPNVSSTNTIYAVFRDKAGNTSLIYEGDNTKYTVTFDANGGVGAPEAQTTTLGMPLKLTSEKPTYEGKYFMGWSEVKGSTAADYEGTTLYNQGDTIGANSFSGDKTNITLYAAWSDEISDLPLLSDMVEVGDYVNYPVFYDNVYTYNGQYKASLKGWRVLSKEDDGTVNLVSAGVPLTYYHYNNSETSIKNLAINFLDIPFGTTENYTFRKTGFNPYVSLEETFNNKYTATYESYTTVSYTSTYNDGTVVTYEGEKKAGDLKVRSMTKEDLDKVYDPTGETVTQQATSVTNKKYEKLLAIPSSDVTDRYALYWLASAYSSDYLRYVVNYGGVNRNNYRECGVRPVVSLKSTVRTTGTDLVGAWNIEVE